MVENERRCLTKMQFFPEKKTEFFSGISFPFWPFIFHYDFSYVVVLALPLPCCAVTRVIEQCCFNSTPDPFNDQTANFALKPPKVIDLMLKKPIRSATETTLFYSSGDSTTGQVCILLPL